MLPVSSQDGSGVDGASHPYLNQSDQFLNAADLVQMAHQQSSHSGGQGQVDPSIYPQYYMQYDNSQGQQGYDSSSRPSSVPYPSWSADNHIGIASSFDGSMFYGPGSADYSNPHFYNEPMPGHSSMTSDSDFGPNAATLTRKPQAANRRSNQQRQSYNFQLNYLNEKSVASNNETSSPVSAPKWASNNHNNNINNSCEKLS